MTLRALVMVCVVLFSSLAASIRVAASSDVVLEWNEIAVKTMLTPPAATPFGQARFAAIVQLAVFEAVNAITRHYQPYLGTVTAPAGASADAAAVAAAHKVLRNYFSGSATALDAARATSLGAIPNGQAKTDGIATGEAAAAAMIARRLGDGSTPLTFKTPGPVAPGEWQTTPGCPTVGGVPGAAFLGGQFSNWGTVTPFGISSAADFILDAPPSLTSQRYTNDYVEVMTFGGKNSAARPQDRSDVARIYRDTSPTNLLNSAARQVAGAQGRSLSENARALALLNMATSDSLVASFANKYSYNFWRPETAIRAGATDGNPKTTADSTFAPYVTTPCFPSYPSNHASGTGGGAEVLRRIYGAGGHSINISSPAVADAGIVLHYTTFKAITNDVDDARVYGGIHFRFDQEAGGRLGRDVAKYVIKHNLRPIDISED
jgi:hypothetical protein